MSVSGVQSAAEINLDELERRLCAPPSQEAVAEDLLAELVRLVDSSALPSPSQAASMRGVAGTKPPHSLERATLHPQASDEPTGFALVDIEAPPAPKFGKAYLPRGRAIKISALALAAGAVLVGAAFELKGGAPGQPKDSLNVAAAEDSTNPPQRSAETVATLSDAGAIPLKDITQPAAVKGAASEEQPIEPGDHASPADAPSSASLAPTSAGAGQPTVGASSGAPAAVAVNPPAATARAPAPPPDPKPLPTASAQPDGTQIATATPAAADPGEAAHPSGGPQRPAKTAPNSASEAAQVAQPSTHKLDSPTKLSRKPSARILVAKTETVAPGPEAGNGAEAAAEPQASAEAPPAPAQQPVNPVSHAFGFIFGALGAPAASAPQLSGKGAASEQPIELGNYASLGNAPPLTNSAPTPAGASSGSPVTAAVNTPVAPPPGAPQFSNPKTKLSAPIVVAKTEAPAPVPASEAPPAPAQQFVNPLSHAFNYVTGALRAPAAPAPQPGAPKSGNWAIQFGGQKSEEQARVNAARLNAKYAAALNGEKIGVDKTLVNGETIYALRVTGLSKADAAALCDRVKGRDCFIVK
jgi:SPOR domain